MSPPGPDTLRVACAVENEGYVPHCAAMLHSLLAQHQDTPVRIDYLHGNDTSPRGRSRLRTMIQRLGADVGFHLVPDDWVQGLPIEGFTGKATWYRIFLPELLGDAPRVLYLDADLLVLDSLLPLWRTPLNGCLVGAVSNVTQRHELGHAEAIGLPNKKAYFNAGVLLMDLELMRAERTTDELRSFSVRNAGHLGWRDQDALNIVLHDRRLALHPRWNCLNSIVNFPWAAEYFSPQVLEEARADPAIRHFEGPSLNKPWHVLCDPALRRLYTEHRRHTPWPRVRPTGLTPSNVLRYVRDRARRPSVSA